VRPFQDGAAFTDSKKGSQPAVRPYCRHRVKLEWEVKPLGTLFDGTATEQSAAWMDIGATGGDINELVSGLLVDTVYHWRGRLWYHPATTPFEPHSRWLTIPWNGWQEADLRMRTLVGCPYDLNFDGDVDGLDLASFAEETFQADDLAAFAVEFGRTDCLD